MKRIAKTKISHQTKTTGLGGYFYREKYGFLTIGLASTLLLTGCGNLSVSLEPEPTTSELEACKSAPEAILLMQSMEGGEGAVEKEQVTTEFSHLSAVTAVLSEEESDLVRSMELYLGSFAATYPFLASPSNGYQSTAQDALDDLEKTIRDLNEVCGNLGLGFNVEDLPTSLEDFYPRGFWIESVSADSMSFTAYSTEDVYDAELNGDEPSFQPNGNTGLGLVLACDIPSEIFRSSIYQWNANFENLDFGPDGKVIEFNYSIDGGSMTVAEGVFIGGMLFPFQSGVSSEDFIGQGIRTWRAFSEAQKSIEIELDVPGARYSSVFLVRGVDKVGEDLDAQGCLAYF